MWYIDKKRNEEERGGREGGKVGGKRETNVYAKP